MTPCPFPTKTITIRRGHIFGTMHYSWDLLYRGRPVHELKYDMEDNLDFAKKWAKNQGYTHFNYYDDQFPSRNQSRQPL